MEENVYVFVSGNVVVKENIEKNAFKGDLLRKGIHI